MRVSELINLLKKCPADAVVVTQSHDQCENEYDSIVSRVTDESMNELGERFGCRVVSIGP